MEQCGSLSLPKFTVPRRKSSVFGKIIVITPNVKWIK